MDKTLGEKNQACVKTIIGIHKIVQVFIVDFPIFYTNFQTWAICPKIVMKNKHTLYSQFLPALLHSAALAFFEFLEASVM